MDDFCTQESFGMVSLDDAFDCYEMSKREVSDYPLYYYDLETNEFVKIKSTMPKWIEEPPIKDSGILFINSYKTCLKIINEYLSQPSMSEHKTSFIQAPKGSNNTIVDFLWFFEHIDGCCDFGRYETMRVGKELKKWCKINGLEYINAQIHNVN